MKNKSIYQHKIRVYTEDVDYMGIVYHANYLCFFERARTEILREKELLLSDLKKLNVLFAINELAIQYRYPAKLDDLLNINTEIKDLTRCSFVFDQQMHNQDEQLISEARIKVVCVNSELKPKRIPLILSEH